MTPPGRWVIVGRGYTSEEEAAKVLMNLPVSEPARLRQTNHQRGRERWCVEAWRPVDADARRLGKKRAASLTPERIREIAGMGGAARQAKRRVASPST